MSGKKLLILSDTHGDVSLLTVVLNWASERLPPNDTIMAAAFLGDGLSDIGRAAEKSGFYSEWKIVSGNNDYGITVPDTAVFEFAGYKFFMTHGDSYNVYSGYHSVTNAGKKNNANVVLFGHTHVPYYENVNGMLLVNPGSVSRPRSRIGESFAVMEFPENEPPKTEFWGISEQHEIFLLALYEE